MLDKTTSETERLVGWENVVDSARTTINKEASGNKPITMWKLRMLKAEHSPIRFLTFKSKWRNLLSWVSVHLVRHKIGIDHFVRSQRTDRAGIDRGDLTQNTLIEHEILINAQAIINISRKRLCNCASKETQDAWITFLNTIADLEPELRKMCVPECIYRGHCPEMKCCGYSETARYFDRLNKYQNLHKAE